MKKPSERILLATEHLGVTLSKLAKSIGKAPQVFYDIRDEKVKSISYEIANLIHTVNNEINPTWLLTGEGDMLLPEAEIKKATPEQERLYIEQRVEKLEQEIRELSSLNASLRKIVQGLIEEMNELKQGVSKQAHKKSSKDAG